MEVIEIDLRDYTVEDVGEYWADMPGRVEVEMQILAMAGHIVKVKVSKKQQVKSLLGEGERHVDL